MPRPSATNKRARRPAASSDNNDDEDGSGNNTDYDSDAAPAGTIAAKKKKQAAAAAAAKKGKGKGKAPAAAAEDDGEDEEGEEGDEEEGGGGDGKGGKSKVLTPDMRNKLVLEVTRYAIFCESNRKLLKREDMTKAKGVLAGYGRYFPELLKDSNKRLRDTLGMELILLRPKETSSKNPPKAYILRSTLPDALLAAMHAHEPTLLTKPDSVKHAPKAAPAKHLTDVFKYDVELGYLRDLRKEEGAAYGILGVVLGLILVSGKVLGDDQLISYLKRLDLKPNTLIPLSIATSDPSSKPLNVITFLTLLSKQGYLERSKPTQATQNAFTQSSRTTQKTAMDAGDPSITWKWGPRVEAELGEGGVARFVQAVYESISLQQQQQQEEEGEGGEGGAGGGRRRKGNTGEKLMNEIARAAGEGQLAEAREVKGL